MEAGTRNGNIFKAAQSISRRSLLFFGRWELSNRKETTRHHATFDWQESQPQNPPETISMYYFGWLVNTSMPFRYFWLSSLKSATTCLGYNYTTSTDTYSFSYISFDARFMFGRSGWMRRKTILVKEYLPDHWRPRANGNTSDATRRRP